MHVNRPVLEARVRGVNRANAFANELYPKLVALFTPLIGQKILKADGTLLAKIQKQVDDLGVLGRHEPHVYRYNSPYSLVYTVKTCEDCNGHAYYYETSVYVAHLDNGVLTGLYDQDLRQTNYSADKVIAAREAYEKAKKAADEAQSALHPFGEYDR